MQSFMFTITGFSFNGASRKINTIKNNIVLLYIIQIYSGITCGRVLDGELLCTKILEVNFFAFA